MSLNISNFSTYFLYLAYSTSLFLVYCVIYCTNLCALHQMEYLQSTKNFVIEDKDSIKQIAQAVSLGKYKRGGSEEINAMMVAFKISVAGYRNDEHITTINMYQPSFILDEKNQRFDYDNSLPDLLLFVPENIKPAILRVFCARNLWFYWEDYKSMVTMQKIYPIPSKWILY